MPVIKPFSILCLPRADSFLNKQPPIEETHPEWELIECPVCGDGCYISPDHVKTLAQFPTLGVACTQCALRGR